MKGNLIIYAQWKSKTAKNFFKKQLDPKSFDLKPRVFTDIPFGAMILFTGRRFWNG
jgi:hypothetical protein